MCLNLQIFSNIFVNIFKYILSNAAVAIWGADSSHELALRGKCLEGDFEVKMGLKTGDNVSPHMSTLWQCRLPKLICEISKMIHGMYLVCVFQGVSLSYVWKNMLDFCTSSKSLIANRRQDLTLIVTHHPHWTWKSHQKYIVLCKSNNWALFVDPWACNMTHHSFSEAICFICLNFSLSNNSSEKKFQFIYFLDALAEWHLMRVT